MRYVSFEEACTAFGDTLSIAVADIGHSKKENRFVLIGKSIKKQHSCRPVSGRIGR